MVGQLFPLSIIAEDENGRKLGVLPVWESSNTSSVFVSSSGVVKALAPGSATVTATYLDLTTWAVVNVLSPKEYAEYLSHVYQEYGTSATSGIATGEIPAGGGGITQPGYGGGVTIINQYVTYLTYSPGATDMLCDLNVCLTGYISRNFGNIQVQNSATYGNYLIVRGNNSCYFIDLSDPDTPRYAGSSEICGIQSFMKEDKVINLGISYQVSSTTILSCSGEGLIFVVPDGCMDDGGGSDAGDSLEIYCCDGIARFCLSWEDCPWRDGCIDTPKTCSRSGLYSDWMATTFCNKWNNITEYYCSVDEQIYFDVFSYLYRPYFVYDISSFSEEQGNLTLTYQGRVSNSGEAFYSLNYKILSAELSGDYLYSITAVKFFGSSSDFPDLTTYYMTYYLNVIDVKNRAFVKTVELSGLKRDIEFYYKYNFSYAVTVHTSPYMEQAKLIKAGDKLYLIGLVRCGEGWEDTFCRIPQLKGIPFVYSVFDVSNPADLKVLDAGVAGITSSKIPEGEIMFIGYLSVFSPVKVGDTIYVAIDGEIIDFYRVSLLFNFYSDSSGVKHNTIFEVREPWYIVQQKPFHISGDRFYLNTSTSVVVFDVSSPRAPKLVNHIFPLQTGSIWVDGGRIYVYGQVKYAPSPGSIGLQVFDLDGALKGLFRLPGMYGIVFAKGRNIYLMGSNLFLSLKYMRPE